MSTRPTSDIRVELANGASDLDGILALQQANLPGSLSEDELRREGFVTVAHTRELLERMHAIAPSVVVRRADEVVGYALTMPVECRDFIPVLGPMFRLFDTLSYDGSPLASTPFYVMGQICIAKAWRGEGLFDAMYAAHRTHFSARYRLLLTEVSQRNGRSLRAHARIGFHTLTSYRDATDDWAVIALDLRRSAPGPRT